MLYLNFQKYLKFKNIIKMRTYLVIFLSAIILSLTAFMSCSKQCKEQQIIEPVESDSIEQIYEEYLPTVYDILAEREEMRYMAMVDSVYLRIPESILTHILVTKGTTISILEIVEDYIANKKWYHDTILKAMEIQRKYVPDSMPKKSLPDKPLIPISDKSETAISHHISEK